MTADDENCTPGESTVAARGARGGHPRSLHRHPFTDPALTDPALTDTESRMSTSLLPRLRPLRDLDVRATTTRTLARLRTWTEQHRDGLRLAVGLVLGGAFLSTLLFGCTLLLLGLFASAAAPAAQELGIGG